MTSDPGTWPAVSGDGHGRVRVALMGGARIYREGLAAALDRSPAIEIVFHPNRSDATAAGTNADVVIVEEPSSTPVTGVDRERVVGLGDKPPDQAGDSQTFAEWLPDEVSLDELIDVVVQVAHNARARDAGHAAAGPAWPVALPPLTARETEVLALVDEALSNREIAERLHVEVSTVKNHMHNVLRKLGTQRRAKAAAWFRAQRSFAR